MTQQLSISYLSSAISILNQFLPSSSLAQESHFHKCGGFCSDVILMGEAPRVIAILPDLATASGRPIAIDIIGTRKPSAFIDSTRAHHQLRRQCWVFGEGKEKGEAYAERELLKRRVQTLTALMNEGRSWAMLFLCETRDPGKRLQNRTSRCWRIINIMKKDYSISMLEIDIVQGGPSRLAPGSGRLWSACSAHISNPLCPFCPTLISPGIFW